MALPRSLLDAVDDHACFSGCYTDDAAGAVCIDPSRPLLPMLVVHCADCLLWHVGSTTAQLPRTIPTSRALAQALSAHVRKHRGFVWSLGGYHAGGLWLSAACLGPGVFVVACDRGSTGPTDPVDALVTAFRRGLAPHSDPGMLDPAQYTTLTVYLRYSSVAVLTPDRASLLASPQCSTTVAPGFRRAVLVEHVPTVGRGQLICTSSNTAAHNSLLPQPSPEGCPLPAPPGLGMHCPTCGHVVTRRALLNSTFVGCMC